MPTVARLCLAVANQVAELVTCRCRGIAELGPRNRHVVRSIGNVQVTVVTVIHVDMVNPHVLGFVIHLEAIFIIVIVRTHTLEFQVADDDVLRAAQLHGTARSRLRNDGTLVAVNRHVATDFHRTHVRTRLHVDNLVARLGVALEVVHVVDRNLGVALAARSAAILRGKTRHRKIRRCHSKRRNRSRCHSHSRKCCYSTNRFREQIIHKTSLFSLNLSRRTRKRIKKEPHTTQSVLYRQLLFNRKKTIHSLHEKACPLRSKPLVFRRKFKGKAIFRSRSCHSGG